MTLVNWEVNSFPQCAIYPQGETLSFSTIVTYNIKSSHLLIVQYDSVVYTISQAREVRTSIPYFPNEETEVQHW